MIDCRANCQIRIPIQDASQIGEARRTAAQLAASAGANDVQSGKYSIVTSELATNVLKHGGGGEMMLQFLSLPGGNRLEALAIDKGPGIASIERCMRDGYSTAGSNGTGLGAIVRQSDEFDIYSAPGSGTVAVSRIRLDPQRGSRERCEVGVVCVPYPGETECGDTWRIAQDDDRCSCLVADGLGHGPQAAEAAQAAAKEFGNDPHGPGAMMRRADVCMRGTRGGAVAVSQIDYREERLRYAGIGNISGTVLAADSSRGLASHNGIVGHNAHRIQELEYPWTAGSVLVMCSDGLQTRWQIGPYAGLRFRHPAVIAAVLFRDFQRGRDDVTVLVVSPPGDWICSRN